MTLITSPVTGNVWKILVQVGDEVSASDELVVLESMKMEIPVDAEEPGKVAELLCSEGQSVAEGEALLRLG
jgi:acetyl-CoA carboxylase biotin carboxyl carrier protein